MRQFALDAHGAGVVIARGAVVVASRSMQLSTNASIRG
jgi:hypothetical protein